MGARAASGVTGFMKAALGLRVVFLAIVLLVIESGFFNATIF
jgi:hypothetical protein